jgi:hypothetical protein
VSRRPIALLELVADARRGEWTDDPTDEGLRREMALAYTYLVSIPICTVAHLVIWIVERPARLATFIAVAVPIWLAIANLLTGGW